MIINQTFLAKSSGLRSSSPVGLRRIVQQGALLSVSLMLGVGLSILPIYAQSQDILSAQTTAETPNVLRMLMLSDIQGLDPHHMFIDLNLQVHAMIFGRLVEYGPKKETRPGVATSWRVSSTNPLEWIFDLREGVRFSSGRVFTKGDVLATFKRMQELNRYGASGYIGQLAAVDLEETARVNKHDPHPYRLKIVTKKPYAYAAETLASILMMSKEDADASVRFLDGEYQKLEGRVGSDGRPLDDRERKKIAVDTMLAEFAKGRFLDGTGPYGLASWDRNTQDNLRSLLVLKPNPNFAGDPKQQSWPEIHIRGDSDPNRRVERLMRGEVDVIADVPFARLAELQRKGFQVIQGPSQRVIHLQLYQTADGRERDPLHAPLRDDQGKIHDERVFFSSRNVRRAFDAAIDREYLKNVIMGGQAVPTGQWMLPGRPGYIEGRKPTEFNPAFARQLLEEASRDPQFAFLADRNLTLSIHGPNDRYPNDEKILRAIADMWTGVFGNFTLNGKRFSIRVEAKPEPKASYFRNLKKYMVVLIGGGIDNGKIEGALRLYSTDGGLNHGNYHNSEVRALYDRGVAEFEPELSHQILTRAAEIALDDSSAILLFNQLDVAAVAPRIQPPNHRIDGVLFPSDFEPAGGKCRSLFTASSP